MLNITCLQDTKGEKAGNLVEGMKVFCLGNVFVQWGRHCS